MSTRRNKDILLGGQPRAKNAPPNAPKETRFLGRGESVSAETINRGVYAVAEELDKAYTDFLQLARKAVTKSSQQSYSTAVPLNFFSQENDEPSPINAYVGLTPSNNPSQFFEILRPGTTSPHQENTERAFTVYEVSGGSPVFDAAGQATVAFQVRSLAANSDEINIVFDDSGTGALVVAVNVPGGSPEDREIVVTYDTAGSDTFADVASAINLDVNSTSKLEAFGNTALVKDHAAVNPADNASNFAVPLKDKASVDVQVNGIFIDDPISGADLPVPSRWIARYEDGTGLVFLTDEGTGLNLNGVRADDYVMVSAHHTQTFGAGALPTGRHAIYKVDSVVGAVDADTAVDANDVVVLADAFTLLEDSGYADIPAELTDEEQVYFVVSRYQPQHWAVGHSHSFDPSKPDNANPLPFTFAQADNAHWFQGTNGIPFVDFATSASNIIRVADFKSLLADSGTVTSPSLITATAINRESPGTGLSLTGLSETLHLLVQPRFSGATAATPRVSLEDLRFVFSTDIPSDPSGARATIRRSASSDPTVAFDTTPANTLTAKFEKIGTTPAGWSVYRLDPFTVVDGNAAEAFLFSGNSNFFYSIEIDPVSTTTALLQRVYFEGAFAGSAALSFKSPVALSPGESRSFDFTDVEVWVTHEGGEPDEGISGIKLDLHLSSTGKSGSYVPIKRGVDLTLSHRVSSGPFREVYAYRGKAFPEGYTLTVDTDTERLFLTAHIIQPGAANTHRRVSKVHLVDSHKNSADQLGAYVGDAMQGVSLEPVTQETVVVESEEIRTSADGLAGQVFTDTGVTDFTTDVSAGDWLVIIDAAANVGNHRIESVAANTLTLATPDATLVDTAAAITYKVVRGGNPVFPAGIEGGSRAFYYATNVDTDGVGGSFDLGVGSYARFADIPPDALQSSPGSFGDTNFLTAKIAEIMGTSISQTVPPERNLVNLDLRIRELSVITVGLGTLSPLSFGRFNVSDFGSVEQTIALAISALPATGGVIEFKPGVYGNGLDGNGGALPENKWLDSLYLDADNVTLRAESPGTVEFYLNENAGTSNSVNIVLRGEGCGVEGVAVNSTTTANSPNPPGVTPAPNPTFDPSVLEGCIWLGGPDGGVSPVILPSVDQHVTGCEFKNQAFVAVGYPGAGSTRLEATVTTPRFKALDFRSSSCAVSIYVATSTPVATAANSYGVEGLRAEDIRGLPSVGSVGGPSIHLSSVIGAFVVSPESEFYASDCRLLAVEDGVLSRPKVDNCSLVSLQASQYLQTLSLRTQYTATLGTGLEKVLVVGGVVLADSTVAKNPIVVSTPASVDDTLIAEDVVLADLYVDVAGSTLAGLEYHALSITGDTRRVSANNIRTQGTLLAHVEGSNHALYDMYSSGIDAGTPVSSAVIEVDNASTVHLRSIYSKMGTNLVQLVSNDDLFTVVESDNIRVEGMRALGRSGRFVIGDGITDIDTIDVADLYLNNGSFVDQGSTNLSGRNIHGNGATENFSVLAGADDTFVAFGIEHSGSGTVTHTDGQEIAKFGVNPTSGHSFRIWSHGEHSFLTTNVSEVTMTMTSPSAPPVIIDVLHEDTDKPAFVMGLGTIGAEVPGGGAPNNLDGFLGLWASAAGAAVGGGAQTLKPLVSFRGRLGDLDDSTYLGSTEQKSYMGLDSQYIAFSAAAALGTSPQGAVAFYQFQDGSVVLVNNLELEGTADLTSPSVKWHDNIWIRRGTAGGSALVFSRDALDDNIYLCTIPATAAADTPLSIQDYKLFKTDVADGALELDRKVRSDAGVRVPAAGDSYDHYVSYVGAHRFQGSGHNKPGLILAPGPSANASIMHDFSDLLAHIGARTAGTLAITSETGTVFSSASKTLLDRVGQPEQDGLSLSDAVVGNGLRVIVQVPTPVSINENETRGTWRPAVKLWAATAADLGAIEDISLEVDYNDGGGYTLESQESFSSGLTAIPNDERWFLMLPPFVPKATASEFVQMRYTIRVNANNPSITLKRLHLYSSESGATGRISPTWTDNMQGRAIFSPLLTVVDTLDSTLYRSTLSSQHLTFYTDVSTADRGLIFREADGTHQGYVMRVQSPSGTDNDGVWITAGDPGSSTHSELRVTDSGKLLHQAENTVLSSVVRRVVFTNDGTFVAPPGVEHYEVTVVGHGGGGGGGGGGAAWKEGVIFGEHKTAAGGGGGGGGGGGAFARVPIRIVAGTSMNVTVGAARSGGSGGAGSYEGGGAGVGETGADGNPGNATTEVSRIYFVDWYSGDTRRIEAGGGSRGGGGNGAFADNDTSNNTAAGAGAFSGAGGQIAFFGDGEQGDAGQDGTFSVTTGASSTVTGQGGDGGDGGRSVWHPNAVGEGGAGGDGSDRNGIDGERGTFPGGGGGGGGGGGARASSIASSGAGSGGDGGEGAAGVVILEWSD